MLMWAIVNTFLGYLIVFIALLGGLEVNMTVIFMFELMFLLDFLPEKTPSVLTV
jgi:hypothetical protein